MPRKIKEVVSLSYVLEPGVPREDVRKYLDKSCNKCFGRGVSHFKQDVDGRRVGVVCRCVKDNRRKSIEAALESKGEHLA